MGKVEAAMRAEIARDLDCSATALRLMSLRAEVAELARRRIRIGDNAPDRCPRSSKASLCQRLIDARPRVCPVRD
jgi:hypothetical protein